MARNKATALTTAQQVRSDYMAKEFNSLRGRVASVDYTKRDGSEASLFGFVREVKGEGSSAVVIIETPAGFRSANLWNVKSVN